MALSIHPRAAEKFDATAVELRGRLRQVDRGTMWPPRLGYEPDVVPVLSFTERDIAELSHQGVVNTVTGKLKRMPFDDGQEAWELDEQGCSELERLVVALQASGDLGEKVSANRIQHEVREWLNPAHGDERRLLQRLVQEISPDIVERTAWVPVAFLHIQSDLRFGDVVFRSIAREFLDRWVSSLTPSEGQQADQVQAHFQRLRENFQGLAAVTLTLEAEPERCAELASFAADRAVSLLRTFCMENLHPSACSYCLPHGRMPLLTDHVWLFGPGAVFSQKQAVAEPMPAPWVIADSNREELVRMGLQDLADLAGVTQPTEFQSRLLGALLIYNRANVSRDPLDKLNYVLVALETMLLRSDTESIQAGVADRLAFVVGRDAEERIRIARLLRTCYDMRSRFFHHGVRKENTAFLEDFLKYAWAFFTRMVRSHRRFTTKNELLDSLERRKFA